MNRFKNNQHDYNFSAAAAANKDLYRAMMKEQIDARPVSIINDNDDMRYYERKQVNTLPHSYRYKSVNSQPISKGRVKFEPKIERPAMSNGYEKSPKEVPSRKKEYYQQTTSSTSDSEYESILGCQYINEDSEHESFFDHNDYSRTLTEMESKMNATTNQYFRKIKSTLSDTCSKLKFQQKQKPTKSKNSNDNKAAGDFKGAQEHPENDHVIERILKMKSDCYKKIDQNLKILQQIDDVNDKLYNNYISKN